MCINDKSSLGLTEVSPNEVFSIQIILVTSSVIADQITHYVIRISLYFNVNVQVYFLSQ